MFLVHPQLFETPSFSTSIVATLKRVQEHLQLSIALVESVGEVLVALHAVVVDKTIVEEGRMKVEQEVIDLCRWYQQLEDT
jgi:hypothetical protein